ncbi:hypothetical protein AB0P15_00795 [Streptomyces sp. NPDC087917]|uniref:hypothetical protein n=1 Tax=Streptomyces sp. NPDC087917 TaxID=3155060 RepID=UPI003421E166
MQSRRALPLFLAVLVLVPVAGCVTVRSPAPERRSRPAPVAAGTARAPSPGLPLGSLPEVVASQPPPRPADAEVDPGPAEGGDPEAAPPPGEDRSPRRNAARAPGHASGHAPGHAGNRVQARAPAASAAKPRAKKPVRPKAPPAPGRSYDMAPLCAAAKGTVSPQIAALCR